nr:hypothetical protein [Paraburkholderia sp. BL8N3]
MIGSSAELPGCSLCKNRALNSDREIQHVEKRFKHGYEILPVLDVSPCAIMRNLAADITSLMKSLNAFERDLLGVQRRQATQGLAKVETITGNALHVGASRATS